MSASDVTWEPNHADLNQAVLLLQALRDPTRPDHSSALHSLEANATVPAFILHIMHAFAHGMNYNISVDLRQLSGLIIKNYVFPHLHQLDPAVQQIIKRELLQVLSDSMPDLRKTAAILIGRIAETFPIETWIFMLVYIIDLLDVHVLQSNPNLFDGALYAIKRICEDSSVKMSAEENTRPLESLVPKLIYLLGIQHPTVRLHALECYNCLLYLLEGPHSISLNGLRSRNSSFDSNGASHSASSEKLTGSGSSYAQSPTGPNASHPLVTHMHAFISAIAALGHDRQADLRKQICISITAIACLHVKLLEPYMANILEYMLTMLQDAEEAVAMEACEFFMALMTESSTRGILIPHAGPLIANIISRLYLTPEQMEAERIEEEDESTGAKQVNIQPIHHRASGGDSSDGHGGGGMGEYGGGGGGSTGDDYADQSELSSKWTLRKQSALLLDNLAVSFDNHLVLSIALPIIQTNFQHENVLVREAGMLALGALCNGCLDNMVIYIPQLFPFLLQNLLDPLPEMRSITCWVLSKYSRLYGSCMEYYSSAGGENTNGDYRVGGEDGAMSNSSGKGHPSGGGIGFGIQQACGFYVQSLYAILNTMYDPTPKVQVAACSALCIMIEHSFPLPSSMLLPGQGPTPSAGGGGSTSSSPPAPLSTSSQTSSSSSSMESAEENLLAPHLPILLVYLRLAFSLYGHKAKLILIDTIGTLADTLQGSFQTVHPVFTSLGSMESLLSRYAVQVHPLVVQALHLVYASPPSSSSPSSSAVTQTLSTGQTIIWSHPLSMGVGYVDMYFPSIFHEFVLLEDHDSRLFPILECYTSLLAIVGQETRVYLPYIIIRCVKLLMLTLLSRDVYRQIVHEWESQLAYHHHLSPHSFSTFPLYPPTAMGADGLPSPLALVSFYYRVLMVPVHPAEDERLHTDYAICVLDVLSALSECLQEQLMVYLLPLRAVLVHLVCMGCKESLPECRQSAFSLLGELVKHSLPWLMTATTTMDLSPQALAWPLTKQWTETTPPGSLASPASAISTTSTATTSLASLPTCPLREGSTSLALLREVMALCLGNMDVAYPLVCNNASWTLGELVMALHAYVQPISSSSSSSIQGGFMSNGVRGAAMSLGGSAPASSPGQDSICMNCSPNPLVADFLRAYISKTVHALVTALQSVELADNLKVNIAVTMGRCAVICPTEVAELADDFFADWCSVLSYPCPALEHYHAFSGLLCVVHQHPALLDSKTHLYSLLVACLHYVDVPPDHVEAYHHVLRYCQQQHPALWERVVRTFSQTHSVQTLCTMYALT